MERSEIQLIDPSIDLSAGTTYVVGREGEGSRKFRHIGRTKRAPGGIVVLDTPRRRVSLISYDGELDVVAEATGSEVSFGSKRSGGGVFGHQTHKAATGDPLIIAENSRGAIGVLD